jgi:hypothetical protein
MYVIEKEKAFAGFPRPPPRPSKDPEYDLMLVQLMRDAAISNPALPTTAERPTSPIATGTEDVLGGLTTVDKSTPLPSPKVRTTHKSFNCIASSHPS